MDKIYLKAVNNKFHYYMKYVGGKYYIYNNEYSYYSNSKWVLCKKVKTIKYPKSKYYIDHISFYISLKSKDIRGTVYATPAIKNIDPINYGVKINYELNHIKLIDDKEIFLAML